MYLKIAMKKDCFQILEQDTRVCTIKTATNGIKIMILTCPELRGYSRKLFLRGSDRKEDGTVLEYCDGCEDFINYLRALEEVIDRLVVCLR